MSLEGNVKSDPKLRGKILPLKKIHGKSAYEIALIYGFEGTEEEWLAYLKGKDSPEHEEFVRLRNICVAAADSANKAAEDASEVRAEVAAGGFIESIKEQNKGGKFRVWSGTQAEYDAIPVKENYCLYIIEDDVDLEAEVEAIKTSVSELKSLAQENGDHKGCFFRIIDGETEWINPPMKKFVEYRTTERFLGKPVYTMTFGCLDWAERESLIRENGQLFIGNSPALVIDSNVMVYDWDEGGIFTDDSSVHHDNGVPYLQVGELPEECDLYATFKYIKNEV